MALAEVTLPAPSEGAPLSPETEKKLRAAMAGAHRTESARARDPYRHPVETLGFFGLKDDMTVVELWAGSGWYTALLGPVLAERGKLVATIHDATGQKDDIEASIAKSFLEKKEKYPEALGKVATVTEPKSGDVALGAEGSVDLVVSFRSVHNWMDEKYEAKVFAAAFRVLKHGGVFGLTEHRAKPGSDPKLATKTGYVPEAYVVALAERAGFKLAARSEINANPKDTKDYAKGVWTLPPVLELGDKDREKYVAIGESDRMTLKFGKP